MCGFLQATRYYWYSPMLLHVSLFVRRVPLYRHVTMCIYIPWLMNTLVVFCLFFSTLYKASINECAKLYLCTCLYFSIVESGMLTHSISVCLTLLENTKIFSNIIILFYLSVSSIWELRLFHIFTGILSILLDAMIFHFYFTMYFWDNKSHWAFFHMIIGHW